MALKYLADTSVFSRLSSDRVHQTVRELIRKNVLARCAFSDLELGFSARNATEWDTHQRAISVMELIEVQHSDFVRARGVQRALAAECLKGRKVPDLVIAAVAERRALTLLHYDRDFDLIAHVTGQPVEWVAERGSVD